MADYNANGELDAHAHMVANYEVEHAAWQQAVDGAQATYDAQYAAWEVAHAAWLANPNDPAGVPLPEPLPPEPAVVPLEPQPPAKPATYRSRDVTEPETIETATGPALVVPPRVVLTGPTGAFALSADELAAGYTAAT